MATVPKAARTAPAAAQAQTAEESKQLADRLRAIATGATSPEEALEPMLAAVMEASGAAAGAVCLYDARQQLLRLAAENGLSDEGCKRLRTVRRGDVASWDMPLHGMLNRRAYLIESAARNRYVPPLVEDAAAVRTVACLPLYSGSTPLASLILVALKPRTFGDREIKIIDQPLREMGRLVEAMRQRAARRREPSAAAAQTAPGSRQAPREQIRPASERTDAAQLAAQLARVERERDRLAAELEAARQGQPAEGARVADLVAEIDRLRTQLAESEAGAAHEHRAREELEARLAGGVSSGQQELRKAVEAARQAQRERAAALTELARARAELEHARLGASRSEERRGGKEWTRR